MSKISDPPNLKEVGSLLLIAAQLVDRYGPSMQPWLDRAEREYWAVKSRGTNVDRIKKMLAEHDNEPPQE
ncbi:hypothetical protein QD357_01900 [Rhizobium sp. BR 317]|uniref:hypothetical protein n=1 Tax=Rhizobium sp. BR 317 TaxID=3040015 RepID=UPI0039BFD31F